jgi:hypothetical protein
MSVTNKNLLEERGRQIQLNNQPWQHDLILFLAIKGRVVNAEIIAKVKFGDDHVEGEVVHLVKEINHSVVGILKEVKGLLTIFFYPMFEKSKEALFSHLSDQWSKNVKVSVKLKGGRWISSVHEVLLNVDKTFFVATLACIRELSSAFIGLIKGGTSNVKTIHRMDFTMLGSWKRCRHNVFSRIVSAHNQQSNVNKRLLFVDEARIGS